MNGYPRLVPMTQMQLGGSLSYRAVVQMVQEPGNLRTIETVIECDHRHRSMRAAKECARGLADRCVQCGDSLRGGGHRWPTGWVSCDLCYDSDFR